MELVVYFYERVMRISGVKYRTEVVVTVDGENVVTTYGSCMAK